MSKKKKKWAIVRDTGDGCCITLKDGLTKKEAKELNVSLKGLIVKNTCVY